MKSLLAGLLVCVTTGLIACDVAKRLTSDTVVVATLLTVPDRQVSATELTGTQGSGVNAEPVTVPGSTSAWTLFGEFEGVDEPPTGLTGAAVTLQSSKGAVHTLAEVGGGTYQKSNATGGQLKYEEGATYTLAADYEDETYEAQVSEVPAVERIPQLEPSQGYLEVDANSALVLERPAPASGQERNLGFVTVFPLSGQGERGQPTYSNLPTTPVELLKLVAGADDFRAETVELPGTAFPQTNTTYLVVFYATKLGSAKSTNLQQASVFLAGTAQVGVVRTRP